MKILLMILLCAGFVFADESGDKHRRKHRPRKHKVVKVVKVNKPLPLPKSPSLLITTQELTMAPFVRPPLPEAPLPPVLTTVTVTTPLVPDVSELPPAITSTDSAGNKKWWFALFGLAAIPFLFHDHDQPPVMITPASGPPVSITPFTVPPTSTPESSTIILFALGIGLLRIGKVVWKNN